VRIFDHFLLADSLSVPCILGTEFIKQSIEAILPRLLRRVWQDHLRCTAELIRPTPILACLNESAWEHNWQDKPARVLAREKLRVQGHQEEWIKETCDTPCMVTITPNVRCFRHKSMAVSRSAAIFKPDEPFLVKLRNFSIDHVIARKSSTLRLAEHYQGPMVSAVLEDKVPEDGGEPRSTDPSRDPLDDLDLSEAPEHMHMQIRDMLKTHSSMWDGTLGVIRATDHAVVTPPDA